MAKGIVSLDLLAALVPIVEGGLHVDLINKTGSASVKGSVIAVSTTLDNAVKLNTTNKPDHIGIVYDNGIPDGSSMRVMVAGVAQVLLKNTKAATHGYLAVISDVAGRVETKVVPDDVKNSVGFCLESKAAGTNVLVKVLLNFR
jgi:hypothetical protein